MKQLTFENLELVNPKFPIQVLTNDRSNQNQRDRVCSFHWHEQLELHYITEGELEITIGQKAHILQKGDFALIGENLPHHSFYTGRLQELILIFDLISVVLYCTTALLPLTTFSLWIYFIGSLFQHMEWPAYDALIAELDANGGKITFEIAEGLYQNVQIICTDYASGEGEDTNTHDTTIENVSVSTSVFMIFWGTIGGVTAVAIAVAVFFIQKKKRNAK